MSTTRAIEELVNRFVEDICGLVRHVRRDALANALRALGGSPPAAPARKKRKERPAPKRAEVPAPRRARRPVAAKASNPRSAPARKLPSPAAAEVATYEEAAPGSERRPEQGASVREAAVLEAVRFLVRATAGEIADRCGLPNGTVYVVLRALVAGGKVARFETGAGIEYSLVSAGGIHPFRRRREGAGAGGDGAESAGAAGAAGSDGAAAEAATASTEQRRLAGGVAAE